MPTPLQLDPFQSKYFFLPRYIAAYPEREMAYPLYRGTIQPLTCRTMASNGAGLEIWNGTALQKYPPSYISCTLRVGIS